MNLRLPDNCSIVKNEELVFIDGGFKHFGKTWNNKPLYSQSYSRAEYEFWSSFANILFGTGIGVIGGMLSAGVGTALGTVFSLATSYKSLKSYKNWTKAVDMGFTNGKKSYLYVTAIMNGSKMVGTRAVWQYTLPN